MANGRFGKLFGRVMDAVRTAATDLDDSAPNGRPTPTASPRTTRDSSGATTAGSTGSKAKTTKPKAATPASAPSRDDGAGSDGVVVSYAPERDGDADPGEVVWTWVAYEDDPSQGKDRPVLILGWDGKLLAGVQLSSKNHAERRDAGEWVPVGTGAWDSQGRPSYADANRLLRIEPNAVRREGAALDRDRFDEVVARVERLHDWHR
jgi:hypothetical protein